VSRFLTREQELDLRTLSSSVASSVESKVVALDMPCGDTIFVERSPNMIRIRMDGSRTYVALSSLAAAAEIFAALANREVETTPAGVDPHSLVVDLTDKVEKLEQAIVEAKASLRKSIEDVVDDRRTHAVGMPEIREGLDALSAKFEEYEAFCQMCGIQPRLSKKVYEKEGS
jgi:hypothetical protein